MSRRWPTARTSTASAVSTKITRQSRTLNRAPNRPVRRLTLPAPVSAKRAILASMSARTLGGSLRGARRASWVHAIVFTNANISNRDNFSQRISQTVMWRAAMGSSASWPPAAVRDSPRHVARLGTSTTPAGGPCQGVSVGHSARTEHLPTQSCNPVCFEGGGFIVTFGRNRSGDEARRANGGGNEPRAVLVDAHHDPDR